VRLWALGKLDTQPHHDHPEDELADAAAAFGLRVDGASTDEQQVFCLLPESVPSLVLWWDVQTQWRTTGVDGVRCGLDYQSVEALLRCRGYGPGKRKSIRRALDDIRAMEYSAMSAWQQLRDQEARKKRG
jgi:hypothetical protein